MTILHTTLGPYHADQLGLILPHEHIFVDLNPIEEQHWPQASAAQVVPVMQPYLEQAATAGVTALVECTPVGVGRRADLVKAVSQAAGLPVVVPTGIYREPWVPAWAYAAPLEELRDWMLAELTGQIEASGVPAAWIKLSAGDDGLAPVERKILRAAAQAGRETGAVIGSHTVKGQVVLEQLSVITQEGYSPERFIWIHTQAEADFDLHLQVARLGAWLEYDSIGGDWVPEARLLENIQRLLAAGCIDQLLLSQDRGWYNPSLPNGGPQMPYTYLSETFLPRLRQAGVSAAEITTLTEVNPWRAFAR